LHLKRPGLDHFRTRLNHADQIGRKAVFLELQPRQRRSEAAGVDRLFQHRPQMRQRTKMVLMRVGDENRLQPVLGFDQPGDVRQDQIDAGGGVHIRECHAQIDKDQTLFPRKAIAVDIGIHADLASAAKRHIDQAFTCHRKFPCCNCE